MDERILNDVKSIEFDRNQNKLFGIKSGIVWGHTKGSGSYPLLYISKPRWMSREEFNEILDRLSITIFREPINQLPKTGADIKDQERPK